jgi:hypothetical protein
MGVRTASTGSFDSCADVCGRNVEHGSLQFVKVALSTPMGMAMGSFCVDPCGASAPQKGKHGNSHSHEFETSVDDSTTNVPSSIYVRHMVP